ncbi:hypothetical protein, partial [Trinickia dinghuensis]
RVRHQAPTLIGCKFLKIASLNRQQHQNTFSSSTARLALLRQQQRNEIMQNFLHRVNSFFSFVLTSLANKPLPRTPRKTALRKAPLLFAQSH